MWKSEKTKETLKKMWKILLLFLAILPVYSHAQTLTGMNGLLNIPSADIQADGTFIMGANYLPGIDLPSKKRLNTINGNYYFNLTFLPFLEVAFKMTLIKTPVNPNQDRSASFKIRLIKERTYIPSITFGMHDIDGNQNFEANYLVLTKHIILNRTDFGFTGGYGSNIILKKSQFIGLFGGLSVRPSFFKPLQLMAEYDTQGTNLGGSLLLFNHLYLFSMAQRLRYFAGGVAYRIYL